MIAYTGTTNRHVIHEIPVLNCTINPSLITTDKTSFSAHLVDAPTNSFCSSIDRTTRVIISALFTPVDGDMATTVAVLSELVLGSSELGRNTAVSTSTIGVTLSSSDSCGYNTDMSLSERIE
jgi:hypothetical protein